MFSLNPDDVFSPVGRAYFEVERNRSGKSIYSEPLFPFSDYLFAQFVLLKPA